MRNLDKLNSLLANETSLPMFRRNVPPSLGNLNWLRSKFKTDNPEIKSLLALSGQAAVGDRTMKVIGLTARDKAGIAC